MNQRGIADLGLRESTSDNASFSTALDTAKAESKHGVFVDPQPAAKLDAEGTRTFLAGDGTAGAAVQTDGNIVGIFKSPRNQTSKAVKDLLITAISNGGTKLDCYNGNLSKMYTQMGFVPVARMDFNPEYATEWKPEFGTPDVIFWMHNGDSPGTVATKTGGYDAYTQEQIAALPTFTDYDAAYQYRDMLLVQSGNDTGKPSGGQGTAAPQSSGAASDGSAGSNVGAARNRISPPHLKRADGTRGLNVGAAANWIRAPRLKRADGSAGLNVDGKQGARYHQSTGESAESGGATADAGRGVAEHSASLREAAGGRADVKSSAGSTQPVYGSDSKRPNLTPEASKTLRNMPAAKRDDGTAHPSSVEGDSETVTNNQGKEIDITPDKNHSTTSKNPGYKGEPNSSVDILDKDGNVVTRRWFDENGNAIRDVDLTNHGNPKQHPEWPHEHFWGYGPDGKPTNR